MVSEPRTSLETAFAAARSRVPEFVDKQFGWRGALRLHRHLIGLDMIIAPINLIMSAPALFARLLAMILRFVRLPRLAGRIDRTAFFLPKRSGRELERNLRQVLLRDAEIEALLHEWSAQRHVAFVNVTKRSIAEYMTARTAFAEFTAALIVLLTGFIYYSGLTPGAFTLAPYIAREYAQSQAIDSFMLGSWAGSIWYDYFPAETDWWLLIYMTIVIMVAMALVVSVIGIVIDPLQRVCQHITIA